MLTHMIYNVIVINEVDPNIQKIVENITESKIDDTITYLHKNYKSKIFIREGDIIKKRNEEIKISDLTIKSSIMFNTSYIVYPHDPFKTGYVEKKVYLIPGKYVVCNQEFFSFLEKSSTDEVYNNIFTFTQNMKNYETISIGDDKICPHKIMQSQTIFYDYYYFCKGIKKFLVDYNKVVKFKQVYYNSKNYYDLNVRTIPKFKGEKLNVKIIVDIIPNAVLLDIDCQMLDNFEIPQLKSMCEYIINTGGKINKNAKLLFKIIKVKHYDKDYFNGNNDIHPPYVNEEIKLWYKIDEEIKLDNPYRIELNDGGTLNCYGLYELKCNKN